jgi:hypothetical protein
MKFRLALLAATVLAAPVTFSHAASAQPVTGPYVSLGGGYNIQDSEKVKDIYLDRAPVDAEAKIFTKNGYDVMGSVGYGFGNGFRAEIEGDYIRGDFDKVKEGGVAYRTAGSERRFGGFLNAYYDLDIGLPFLYPYLGGGIGLLDDDFHHFGVNPNLITKERVALAYQGIAGVSVPIAYVPGLSVTLEYRFVALANSRKYSGSFAGPTESFKVGHEYNNEINAGLRYELFQRPRPLPRRPPRPISCSSTGTNTTCPRGQCRLSRRQRPTAIPATSRPSTSRATPIRPARPTTIWASRNAGRRRWRRSW